MSSAPLLDLRGRRIGCSPSGLGCRHQHESHCGNCCSRPPERATLPASPFELRTRTVAVSQSSEPASAATIQKLPLVALQQREVGLRLHRDLDGWVGRRASSPAHRSAEKKCGASIRQSTRVATRLHAVFACAMMPVALRPTSDGRRRAVRDKRGCPERRRGIQLGRNIRVAGRSAAAVSRLVAASAPLSLLVAASAPLFPPLPEPPAPGLPPPELPA